MSKKNKAPPDNAIPNIVVMHSMMSDPAPDTDFGPEPSKETRQTILDTGCKTINMPTGNLLNTQAAIAKEGNTISLEEIQLALEEAGCIVGSDGSVRTPVLYFLQAFNNIKKMGIEFSGAKQDIARVCFSVSGRA